MAMTVVCVWCDRTKRNLPSYSKKPWNIVQFILCCHSLWLSKNEDDATAFVPKCVSASNPTNRTQFPEMTFPKSGSGWLSLVVRQMTNGNVCVNLIQQTEGNFLSDRRKSVPGDAEEFLFVSGEKSPARSYQMVTQSHYMENQFVEMTES